MTTPQLPTLGRRFIRDTEQFLNTNREVARAAWPRLAAEPCPEASELTVFVGGNLYLDLEVRIDLPFPEWLPALQAGQEKVRHTWQFTRCELGGYPIHAIRTALAKGVKNIYLGAALPRKRPRALQGSSMPRTSAPVPWSTTGRCRTLSTFASATTPTASSSIRGPRRRPSPWCRPGTATCCSSTRAPARRRPLLSFLKRLAAERPHVLVGVVARDDWAPQDWHLLQGSGAHVFLNGRELAASLGAPGGGPIHLLNRLRSLVADYTVTATLGGEGAMILGRAAHVTQVPAAAIAPRRLCGAGDTFCTTAVLAMALGNACGQATLLAALDAARWVSGQAPTSLAELSEELCRRPEMIERHLPWPREAA